MSPQVWEHGYRQERDSSIRGGGLRNCWPHLWATAGRQVGQHLGPVCLFRVAHPAWCGGKGTGGKIKQARGVRLDAPDNKAGPFHCNCHISWPTLL